MNEVIDTILINCSAKYTVKSINNNECELGYRAWVSAGELSERFSKENINKILKKFKQVVAQA